MKWEIQCRIWKKKDFNKSISLIFDQITNEFYNLIPDGPPRGYKTIHLVNDLFYDHRIYWPLHQEYYKIGLNTGVKNYGKAAYQFTHELIHIYCDPRVINWFIEIMAHVASFYILDLFTEKWEEDPPKGLEPGSHDVVRCFKVDLMRECHHKIDLVQHQVSSEWIKKEVADIHQKPRLGNRIIYNIIALEILPVFVRNPELWTLLPYIGKSSDPAPPEDERDLRTTKKSLPDFNKLKKIVPANLSSSLEELLDRIWL